MAMPHYCVSAPGCHSLTTSNTLATNIMGKCCVLGLYWFPIIAIQSNTTCITMVIAFQVVSDTQSTWTGSRKEGPARFHDPFIEKSSTHFEASPLVMDPILSLLIRIELRRRARSPLGAIILIHEGSWETGLMIFVTQMPELWLWCKAKADLVFLFQLKQLLSVSVLVQRREASQCSSTLNYIKPLFSFSIRIKASGLRPVLCLILFHVLDLIESILCKSCSSSPSYPRCTDKKHIILSPVTQTNDFHFVFKGCWHQVAKTPGEFYHPTKRGAAFSLNSISCPRKKSKLFPYVRVRK